MPGIFDFLGDMYRREQERMQRQPTPEELRAWCSFRRVTDTHILTINHPEIIGEVCIELPHKGLPLPIRPN